MDYPATLRRQADLFGKAIFEPEEGKKPTLFSLIWIIALYLLGIFLWGELFNWHRTPLDYFDWVSINLPRLQVIRDALNYGQLPLHVANIHSLHDVTDRFLSIPDVVTTPQMVLLRFVDTEMFVLLDVFVFYTIATLGLLWFKQKYKLSLIAYSVLFFLFNFNGYIQSHYSVGHISWGGYFLFPWFFILVFNFVEGSAGWRWVSGVAFLLFYMLLAGSEHHFLWLMIFLALLAVQYGKRSKWIVAAIVSAGLLGAVRLLPPLLEVGKFTSDPGLAYYSGYQSTMDVLSSMFSLSKPINDMLDSGKDLLINPLFPWETDIYLGLMGGLFVLYFGIFKWVKDQNAAQRFRQLLLPAIVLFILAQGDVYKFTLFRIPFFASERVSARMIAVPFTLLMFIAAVYFQEWLNTARQALPRWAVILGLLVLVSDLWSHLKIWRVNVVSLFFQHFTLAPGGNSLANHEDPAYIGMLVVGLALSVLSAGFLLFKSLREKKPAAVE